MSIVPPLVPSMDEAGVLSAERWSHQYLMRVEDQLGLPELYSDQYRARSPNKVVGTASNFTEQVVFLSSLPNTFELLLVQL